MNANSLKNFFLILKSPTRSPTTVQDCAHMTKPSVSKGRPHTPNICGGHFVSPPSKAGQQMSTHPQPWPDRDHSVV